MLECGGQTPRASALGTKCKQNCQFHTSAFQSRRKWQARTIGDWRIPEQETNDLAAGKKNFKRKQLRPIEGTLLVAEPTWTYVYTTHKDMEAVLPFAVREYPLPATRTDMRKPEQLYTPDVATPRKTNDRVSKNIHDIFSLFRGEAAAVIPTQKLLPTRETASAEAEINIYHVEIPQSRYHIE